MSGAEWPSVSVIVPMRNERDAIGPCLEAVLAQDYPAERLEVVVADGDSGDGSARIVNEYARRDPRVRVVANPKRIVSCGLNAAIRVAGGEVIVRVDGHTRVAPDYVRQGVEALRRTGAENVGGPMCAVGGGLFGDAVALAMSSRFGIGAYFHFGAEEREVDTVYLGCWPRGVFERVGLFDEELTRNQDDEFNYRLRKEGGRIVITPHMRSWYQNRQHVGRLAVQFYEYGEWKVRVLQKHPRQMSPRHFVPPAFVGALAASLIGAGSIPLAGTACIGMAGSYAAFVGAVAAGLTGGRGPRLWAATSTALAVIQLAWGIGFLSGLLRFGDRWGRAEEPPSRLPSLREGEAPAVSAPVSVKMVSEEVGRTE